MIEELKRVHDCLKGFIVTELETHNLNQRTFYAETYLLAWLKGAGALTPKAEDFLISRYKNKDQNHISFHFEFNHIAAWEYQLKDGRQEFSTDFKSLRFRGNSTANWSLLRALVKYKVNRDHSAIGEMKAIIDKFQIKSGLILDDKNVNSFQYHCFSMSLILEMYLLSGEESLKENFLRALSFISKMIMPNGEALYVGRGQNQIFGYGPLIWSLLVGYKMTGNQSWLAQSKLVLGYLARHQHKNGRFSLVLTNLEERFEGDIDLSDEKRFGWYAYNNLFDYLAFLGFYLHRALVELSELKPHVINDYSPEDYKDDHYELRVHKKYIAVMARPGGAWTNDLPVPYIFHRGLNRSVTPFYGGEQYWKSLYDLKALPYPVLKFGNWHLRKRGLSFKIPGGWLWLTPLGGLLRKYIFTPDAVTVQSCLLSLPVFNDVFFLDAKSQKITDRIVESDGVRVEFQRPVDSIGVRFSAKGPMNGWESKRINNRVVFKIL